METREIDASGFQALDVSHAFEITVTQGNSYHVSVTADDNLWEYLDAGVQGSTLRLGLKQGRMYNRTTLRAEITMPALDAIELSGASRATLEDMKSAGNFSGHLSGASRMEGALQAGETDLSLSGASRATLKGSGAGLRLDASGASNTELRDFSVGNASVSLSGASRAEITTGGTLDYNLSGASNLSYSGNPKIGRAETSGASNARNR